LKLDSFEPEGNVVEANSDQMKAMNDAKMKKMEDDKVSEKKNKKNVKEDAKMGRMSDGDLEKGHKKFSSMDQTSPSNKFMVKRFSSEIKRRKKKVNVKEDMKGMSQKSGDKRSTESGAGMTAKGVAKYNRRTGGKLKTAVTTPPSKLKAGSKAAGRRKSFCARSKSWNGPRGKAARRRWNCSYEPEMPMIVDEGKKLFNSTPLSDRVAAWSKKIHEGDTYVKTDRNKFGLPKDLRSVEKKVEKKTTGVNYGVMAQSYVPQGDVIQEKSCGEGEYYCNDRKKCMPIPKGAKVGKNGMLDENPLAVGAVAGIGAGGLYLMNKLRQDANKKKEGTLGGTIQNRTDTINKMLQQNSFKPRGKVIEDFYRKKYDVKDGGYKKTTKMDKSNKRAGDSKKQHRELHKDLAKIKR